MTHIPVFQIPSINPKRSKCQDPWGGERTQKHDTGGGSRAKACDLLTSETKLTETKNRQEEQSADQHRIQNRSREQKHKNKQAIKHKGQQRKKREKLQQSCGQDKLGT